MDFFSEHETEALKMIEKINDDMRSICKSLALNKGRINFKNNGLILLYYRRMLKHVQKYDEIRDNFNEVQDVLFKGANVTLWNGEKSAVLKWEVEMRRELDYLSQLFN